MSPIYHLVATEMLLKKLSVQGDSIGTDCFVNDIDDDEN